MYLSGTNEHFMCKLNNQFMKVKSDFAEKRWRSLKHVSEDRRKSLEDLVEDLRDSREAHEHLSAWLAQKEKMVSILGPTAAEPAMVNNQLQQVQVGSASFCPLRKSFSVFLFMR